MPIRYLMRTRVFALALCFCPWPLIAALDTPVVESPEVMLAYAQLGDPSAQFNLALTLRKGSGGAADQAAAIQWYLKAAEAGFAPAQYNLAVLLSSGDGIAKDEKQALKWFYAAAGQGIFEAQKAL